MVTVLNLRTGQHQYFSSPITPRESVMAAYAQNIGDYNTWEYDNKYGERVEYGQYTVFCGDFAAHMEEEK